MKGIIAFLLLSVLAVNGAVLTKNGRALPRHLKDNESKALVVPDTPDYWVAYFMYSFLRNRVDSPYDLDAITADPNAIYTIFANKWTKEYMDAVVALLNQYPLSILTEMPYASRGIISSLSNLGDLLSTLLGLAQSTFGNTAVAVQTLVQNFLASAIAVGGLAADAAAQQLLNFLRPFKVILGRVYDEVVIAINTILGRPVPLEI